MRANLRVSQKIEFKRPSFLDRLLRRNPEVAIIPEEGVTYTPTIIDLTKIDFSFIDDEGDINIRYTGEGEYYALEYDDELFDAINKAIDKRPFKIPGFVNNSSQNYL